MVHAWLFLVLERCNICQRIKNRMKVLVEKLKLSKVLEKLWIHLTVEFITKLLLVAGKDAILVVYNRLSKMTYFVITTEELVRLFRDNVWKLHRLPESIMLDRRPQFAAEITRKLDSILDIETMLSMLFHL